MSLNEPNSRTIMAEMSSQVEVLVFLRPASVWMAEINNDHLERDASCDTTNFALGDILLGGAYDFRQAIGGNAYAKPYGPFYLDGEMAECYSRRDICGMCVQLGGGGWGQAVADVIDVQIIVCYLVVCLYRDLLLRGEYPKKEKFSLPRAARVDGLTWLKWIKYRSILAEEIATCLCVAQSAQCS